MAGVAPAVFGVVKVAGFGVDAGIEVAVAGAAGGGVFNSAIVSTARFSTIGVALAAVDARSISLLSGSNPSCDASTR